MRSDPKHPSRLRLSTCLTPLFRLVIPVLLIGLIAGLWIMLWRDEDRHNWRLAAVGLMPGTIFFLAASIFLLRLKTLVAYGSRCEATGFGPQIVFDSGEIDSIKVWHHMGFQTVFVTVGKNESHGPRKLWFIPPPELAGWRDGVPPAVQKLQSLTNIGVENLFGWPRQNRSRTRRG